MIEDNHYISYIKGFERRIFYIDVGNLQDKAEQYLSVMNRYRNKLV